MGALVKAYGKCPDGSHLAARALWASCILMSLVVEHGSLCDKFCNITLSTITFWVNFVFKSR